MNLIPVADPEEGAHELNELLSRLFKAFHKERLDKDDTEIFIPAGNTPIQLYRLWEKERPFYLMDRTLLQIDEVIRDSKEGLFENFFKKHLPSYFNQIQTLNQKSLGLRLHENPKTRIAILGLGLNGHVAFHEPFIKRPFYFACVNLSKETARNLDCDEGAWGISYGVDAFLGCAEVFLLVYGSSKKEVLRRFLEKDHALPATALWEHSRVNLITDQKL
jgi:6-phosphogluconolactonase/glucosamine-6-phosphate isomerase/deaminase